MKDLDNNPFFVLGVTPDCTRMEMERQGQLLLSMLEVGFAEARTYTTPVGERERTSEAVREAMATLRDPDRRLRAELWARVPIRDSESQSNSADNEPNAESSTTLRWERAMQALGWSR